MIVSLWHLTGISVVMLPRCLSNFRAIVSTRISRLRDFTITCGKPSVCVVNRGPGLWDLWRIVNHLYSQRGYNALARLDILPSCTQLNVFTSTYYTTQAEIWSSFATSILTSKVCSPILCFTCAHNSVFQHKINFCIDVERMVFFPCVWLCVICVSFEFTLG